MKEYDIIVIGGGSGGLTAASGAAQFGASTALIEKKPTLGGDCLHYGCVPSKALITIGKELHNTRTTAEAFGLKIAGEVQFHKAAQRVKQAIAEVQKHDDVQRFKKLGIDVYLKKAVFVDKQIIELSDGTRLKGKRFVIATGSRPSIPPIEGLNQIKYFTNESVFDLEKLPKRIVCAGAGPVGVELAQALSRLGAEITLINSTACLFPGEDKDIAGIVQRRLEKEMTIFHETRVIGVETNLTTEKKFIKTTGKHTLSLESDAVLIAAGRSPNTKELQLELAGVEMNEDGSLKVKATLQTSQPHIFAAGDVTGSYPFTHAAGQEGQLVISNAVFGLKRKISYASLPWAFYTDPELFHLGLTEQEAREKYGKDFRVYKVNADDNDRFTAERDQEALAKFITLKNGRIIGAHAAGKNAVDWMHEVVTAKAWKKPLRSFSNVVYPYPSHGEMIKHASDQYWRETLFKSPLAALLRHYVKWFR
ncbi:dihydrolipoyl dehydrogenase family protein [Alteribacillus sp. HJP-4]|uniref:dihydrolipoyl dehydrogenase family protein n=1 Tax=Alteribacillus sp. HJP-4 TaxID=2775394 RepID=UPI0035CCCDC5